MYPQLLIDLGKLNKNLKVVSELAREGDCSLMIVTKSFCADGPIVAEILKNEAVDYLADSRIQNIASYADQAHIAGKETVLLRLPMASEVEEVVRYADLSLNSEIETIRMLDRAAAQQNKTHKVLLMIDLGDLREGMFFRDEEAIMAVCDEILKMRHVRLFGIGTNLTCYGAIIPKEDNLGQLVRLSERIQKRFSTTLTMVSGGNSSSVYLIPKKQLPTGINNLRLGEAFILGNETAYSKRIPGTHNDAILLRAQIIECKDKPSLPIGEVGVDAFGEVPHYEDKGVITRAILAVGKQDTNPDGLTPLDPAVEILGGSSDHLLVNTADSHYHLGDVMDFRMDYGALLKLFTSPYVTRTYR
ncbi:MAG: ornithine racemase Orr [Eubacteriales bacterium]|nr:ornithine racemase Orr [Eubacteriales bacterium]MDD3864316.1 ornithine racemase Orr [Eubacteriales bacterium]MDD4444526.1 ornithine racemase Orr [Eubacteriales bacterium]